jgi:phenylacetate-CoA ligase
MDTYDIPAIGTIAKLYKIGKYATELSHVYQMSLEEIRDWQSERLRRIVRHAYDNVELYKRKWNEVGIGPEDIKTIDDLNRLPIVTKEDLRKSFPEGMMAKNYDSKDCRMMATSGSSGTPIKIFVERDRVLFDMAKSFFWMKLTGFEKSLGTTKFGKSLGIVVTREDSMECVMDNEISWPYKGRMHRCNVMDEPKNHVKALNDVKPNTLITYPSVLKNIALFALGEKVEVHQPELIITSGEIFDNHTKKVAEKVFSGQFLNHYGATEGGTIASECPKHEGLHVSWNVIVELMSNGEVVQPGTPGQVVITDLYKKATPIIRYAGLGDVAIMKAGWGACNVKSFVLESVEGRLVDSIILEDGKIVHPYTLTLLMQDVPFISKFQIIQKEMNEIEILIVEERNIGVQPLDQRSKIGRELINHFKEILGDKVKIRIEKVDDIPNSPGSYSHSPVISLVEKNEFL